MKTLIIILSIFGIVLCSALIVYPDLMDMSPEVTMGGEESGPSGDGILLEAANYLLLETGDYFLLE